MTRKIIPLAVAAALVSTTVSAPVYADNIGAAIVGGIIGGALINEANRNKRQTVHRSTTTSVTRARNRETQTSLNYFGFPAGTPDGVMGRKSRDASAQFQQFMGFPVTGRLSQYERDFLVTSYNRALVGGPQVAKAMRSQMGIRAVLKTWHGAPAGGGGSIGYGYAGLPMEVSEGIDEIAAAGDPTGDQLLQRTGFMQMADLNRDGRNDYLLDTAAAGIPYWCNVSGNCTVMVFASTPGGYERNDFTATGVTVANFSCTRGECDMNAVPGGGSVALAAPAPVTPAPKQGGATMASTESNTGLGAIQLFAAPQAAPTVQASLTSHCSKVSLLTSSNGGYMTVSSMTDPELALGEQFCLARSYAINIGETLVSGLSGVTPQQVDAQCDGFGPAVEPYIAKLGTSSSDALVAEVQKFILQSNMSVDQLKNTAGICLFSAYRRDRMDIALGASLLMVAVGERPYAELLGHHLALGFGLPASYDRAQPWYASAVSALEGGQAAVFAPGQPERTALIKAASQGLGGVAALAPVQASGNGAALPTFGLGD